MWRGGNRTHTAGLTAAVAATAVTALLIAPATPAAATTADPATTTDTATTPLPEYRTAPGATTISGALSAGDGPLLKPGAHTDALSPGERKFYTARLDATSDAYLSVVLAPAPGTTLKPERIRLSLNAPDGRECDAAQAAFADGDSAHPLALYTVRRLTAGAGACRQSGTYRVILARTADTADPKAPVFPIELKYMAEPGLKPGTRSDSLTAPPTWTTQPPTTPTDPPSHPTTGGTGFNDAPPLADGTWHDRLQPGETRFYRIPLNWGQQLSATAELPQTLAPAGFYVANGVRLALNNPARGPVTESTQAYQGKPQTLTLNTAPVAYANRLRDPADPAAAMRVAGWYYLQVGLHHRLDEVATGPVPVTLRITITGRPKPAPAYTGDPITAGFDTRANPNAAPPGTGSRPRLILGYTGIGTGTALLLWLGTWRLLARRRHLT
ncbi:hypothetical protein [Streptomyces orinoci]|uniref:Uncharacterized protein n=1 Tax=Streptomyces orinoci TaxID=67339 RepID=A0ABV3JSE3_STRON|nr:hypothetical protein [Streptomyces orinoci]